MKKLLYGVALAFLTLITVGSLQSCKDDWSDLANQTKFDVANLQYQIDGANRALTALNESIQNHRGDIDKLMQDLREYATVKYVDANLHKLDSLLRVNDSIVADTLSIRINGAIKEFNTITKNHELRIDTIDSIMHFGVMKDLEELTGRVAVIDTTLNFVKERIGEMDDSVKYNRAHVDYVIGRLDTLVKDTITVIMSDLQALKDTLFNEGGVFDRLDNLTERVNKIDEKLDVLFSRFDVLVTSIVVQGTDSPIFGNFSLPIGVQSNMLFNWYGYNDQPAYDFPSYSANQNYYVSESIALTKDDFDRLKALGLAVESIPEGPFGDVNLGKVYLTINPAGHLFDSEKFVLQSSAENKFPATLKVKKSTDELLFGYSRAYDEISGNGFYEAEVIVDKDDIDKARVTIDEGLKTAAKDALNDPSKRNAVSLLKAVYNQLNGKLPAYAVRYDWEAADTTGKMKPYSVLSKYEVAATTARPLSYSFLYGKGTSKKLPTFGSLDNFIKNLIEQNLNNIKIEGKDMEVLGYKIGFAKGNVSIGKNSKDNLFAEVTGITVDGKDIGVVEAEFADPADAALYINEAISKALAKAIGKDGDRETIAKFEASVSITLLQMQKQLNEVVAGIDGQIQDAFDNIGNTAVSYAKRLNKLVELYNKVAGKINNVLADPNHYLQVAMFYNQKNGGVGIVSNKKSQPVKFKLANGNINLYASSYTGELLAPAYKKFVAVTMVYDSKTGNKIESEVGAVNAASDYLNKVMSGNTIVYSIPSSALKSGRKYEIVYQGVDYSGRTSTQKFYIQVD